MKSSFLAFAFSAVAIFGSKHSSARELEQQVYRGSSIAVTYKTPEGTPVSMVPVRITGAAARAIYDKMSMPDNGNGKTAADGSFGCTTKNVKYFFCWLTIDSTSGNVIR